MKILVSLVHRQRLRVDAAHAQSAVSEAAAGLLTTTNQAFDRVAMHAVRRELLEAQADGRRPAAARGAAAVAVLQRAVRVDHADGDRGFVADGFTHVAFGDLFLEDVRRYREDRLAGSGLEPLFPIWKTKPTARSRAAT